MTTIAYPNQHATFTGDRRHTNPLIEAYLYKPTPQDLIIPQRQHRTKTTRKNDETASLDTQGSFASTVSLLKRKFRRGKH